MLKRDYLMAQIQQMIAILAKVKRLIVEGDAASAREDTQAALVDYFGIPIAGSIHLPNHKFLEKLRDAALEADEVSLLADFLDTSAGLEPDAEKRDAILRNVLATYDFLAEEHQVASLAQLARRNAIIAALEGP